MSFEVLSIPPFDRHLEQLAKKYPSLKSQFLKLVVILEAAPDQGTPIGNGCIKIRMSIASEGKGKRGGARVVTSISFTENTVYQLASYDQSEKASLTDAGLKDLLSHLPE
jgi:mRNA-degrading endonuclease RelE of RelBE toxin-antitoxin system